MEGKGSPYPIKYTQLVDTSSQFCSRHAREGMINVGPIVTFHVPLHIFLDCRMGGHAWLSWELYMSQGLWSNTAFGKWSNALMNLVIQSCIIPIHVEMIIDWDPLLHGNVGLGSFVGVPSSLHWPHRIAHRNYPVVGTGTIQKYSRVHVVVTVCLACKLFVFA